MQRALAIGIALLILGCSSRSTPDRPARLVLLEFRLVAQQDRVALGADGLTKATVVGTGETLWLEPEVLLSNADVRSARARTGDREPEIWLTFTSAGQRKFTAVTEEHVQRRLAVIADGQVLIAPVIIEKLRGQAVVTGDFTHKEAERIAAGIVPK